MDCLQSCGVFPLRLEKKLLPWTASGTGIPAISNKVGAKSMFETISSTMVPGFIFPG